MAALSRAAVKATDVVRAVTPALRAAGFDIIYASTVGVYNSTVAVGGDADLRLPELSAGPDTLALIVGNSAELWPKFMAASLRSESIRACPHPLDKGYTVPALRKAFEELLPKREPALAGRPSDLRFVHETRRDRVVAVARFAHASGMAWLCPEAYLSVHPEVGPWLSFRAVAVIDADGSGLGCTPAEAPASLDEAQRAVVAGRMADALTAAASAAGDDGGGTAAASAKGSGADAGADIGLSAKSRAFLAVRDACGGGFESHRFPAPMLRFHYDNTGLPGAEPGPECAESTA